MEQQTSTTSLIDVANELLKHADETPNYVLISCCLIEEKDKRGSTQSELCDAMNVLKRHAEKKYNIPNLDIFVRNSKTENK